MGDLVWSIGGKVLTGETVWSIGGKVLTGETVWSIGGKVLTGETVWSIGGKVLTGETVWSIGGKVLTVETVWSVGGKVLTGETKALRNKTCPSATSFTTICMWTEELSCVVRDSKWPPAQRRDNGVLVSVFLLHIVMPFSYTGCCFAVQNCTHNISQFSHIYVPTLLHKYRCVQNMVFACHTTPVGLMVIIGRGFVLFIQTRHFM
jgi:hypothetical protein